MIKTPQVLLIFLLSLLHFGINTDFDDNLQESLSDVSRNVGSCGEYFEYQLIDGFVNGKLELPNIKMGDTVKLSFYKIDSDNHPRIKGILLPDESSEMVIEKVQNGQLISYRVDFPLTLNIPELMKIFVNENELCATKYNRSHEIFHLTHKMQIINGSLQVFTYNINIPHFVENNTCGLIDQGLAISEIKPLIYGGSEIVRGEFPWLAAIYKKQRIGINFLCGGSILTSKIILAAAHCFQGSASNADKIFAVLGRHNLTNYLEDGYMVYKIETLILHPEYKYGIGFSDADLAILKVKNHVIFTQFIQPICLWSGSADESLVINTTALVVGWGSDEDGYTLSAVPKKVKMGIVSEVTCLRSLPAYIKLNTSRTLCAENRDGSGPCEGDSGSGLLINRYGRWMLRGVVSAGLTDQGRCNLPEYTLYCDVAKHTEWLEKYVEEKKLSGSVEEICGISGTDLRSEHPWLAAVYRKLLTGFKFESTGALISSRTLLIIATLVVSDEGVQYPPDEYRIYLGRYDLNNIQENGVVTRDVASIIFHPDYNKSAASSAFQENGIALIQMKSPVGFTEFIRPICLWSEPNDELSDIKGQSATLSSWDITSVYDESFTVPTSVKVNITSIQQCQLWRGDDEGMSPHILCVARLENKNGAVLMFKRNGRWLLRGINALGYDYLTYMSKDYLVYNDLAKYLTWIKKEMLL